MVIKYAAVTSELSERRIGHKSNFRKRNSPLLIILSFTPGFCHFNVKRAFKRSRSRLFGETDSANVAHKWEYVVFEAKIYGDVG